MQSVEGVELCELEPMTTVLVWTWNSLYRVVVSEGSDVLVQGGLLFPQPTPAHVDGASTGGGPLKIGWIGLGLMMELHVCLLYTSDAVDERSSVDLGCRRII